MKESSKKSSRSTGSPWPAAALCLVFLALRTADLAFLTDAATGFPTLGPSALRWGTALAGMAALWAWGGKTPEKICVVHRLPLAAALFLAGAALLGAGAVRLTQQASDRAGSLLVAAAGVWFLAMGGVALRGAPKPPPAALGLVPTAAMLWVLVRRFSVVPAASARLGCTFRVLGALGALLCVGALCKLLFVPGAEYGKFVRRCAGIGCLLALCHELPQAVFEALHGTAQLSEILLSVGIGCVGLCGLAALFTTAARSTPPKKDTAD